MQRRRRQLEEYQRTKLAVNSKKTKTLSEKVMAAPSVLPTQRKFSERKEGIVVSTRAVEELKPDEIQKPTQDDNVLLWSLMNAQLRQQVSILEESARVKRVDR